MTRLFQRIVRPWGGEGERDVYAKGVVDGVDDDGAVKGPKGGKGTTARHEGGGGGA